ncbi:MAG: LysR family transcriptional regulator [Pseudomonadota bacterium]
MAGRRKVFSGQISDVDLRLVRVFKTVIECGGLSAAQTELGIGRSTLSKHITDLETRFGMRLCHRDRSGFRLTQQGRQALVYIEQFVAAANDFKENIAGINDKLMGKIEIGVIDYAVSDDRNPLIKAIMEFREIAPDVTVNPTIGTPSEVERGVIDGRFHIGIVPDYQRFSGLQYAYLYEEIAGLFCGGQHPVAQAIDRGDELDEREIYKSELVHRGFFESDELRRLKQTFPVGSIVNQTEAMLALVEGGMYLGFLPVHCATSGHGDIREILPDVFRYTMPIYAVFRSNRHHSAILQEFLQVMLKGRSGS